MTYATAYQYLLSLTNLARREYLKDPGGCSVYLERAKYLLRLLGNPERKIPHYIHITGTSGKGSVTLMLNSILRAAGQRVGALTSPHPSEILERWEVDGRIMTKAAFTAAVAELKAKLEEFVRRAPYDVPSFSELMTVVALRHFSKRRVGWGVLEVGCGGRYDSTNVIPKKDVAVITNIGLDHVELLGPTRADIAYEKAGIISRGARVFTTEQDPKLIKIFQRECLAKGARELVQLTLKKSAKNSGRWIVEKRAWNVQGAGYKKTNNLQLATYNLLLTNPALTGSTFTYRDTRYTLPVLGTHQIGNAILAIEIARALKIPDQTIVRGLQNLKLPVCLEIISRRPLIILDGAHNPDKMKTTVATIHHLQSSIPRLGPLGLELVAERSGQSLNVKSLNLVVAFSANKNITAMVKQLAALNPKTIACTRFTSNLFRKTANPGLLARQFRKLLPRTTIKTFLDPRAAFAWSRRQQKKDELVLVTGSIFLSGGLRSHFLNN